MRTIVSHCGMDPILFKFGTIRQLQSVLVACKNECLVRRKITAVATMPLCLVPFLTMAARTARTIAWQKALSINM
jgi:hypothetical protein